MGRISISRKEGEVLLSRQLRFSRCKTGSDFLNRPHLRLHLSTVCPAPDTRRLRRSHGCQLCSQMLPFAAPVFLKPFFFFNVGCRGSFPVRFGVGLVNKAGPRQRQPGCLGATDRSVAWWSWQTGLPSGPRRPGQPSLPPKFKYAPSHKCIMGTRMPRLCTYRALSLRLWAPEHTGNCGHPVGTSCFQFERRTRVGFFVFLLFFFKLLPQNPYCMLLRELISKRHLMLRI